MVARNEDLPEDELDLRLQSPWSSMRIRRETLIAIRYLAAKSQEQQHVYVGRAFLVLAKMDLLLGSDPVEYLDSFLREKFPDSP